MNLKLNEPKIEKARSADLDLAEEMEQRKSECIAEYRLSFKDKSFFGIHRSPEGTLPLEISYSIKSKDTVKLNPGRNLLTLDCKGEKGRKINVEIKGEPEVILRVIFSPSAIVDCKRADKDGHMITEFEIDFSINCDLDIPVSIPGLAIIRLRPISAVPEIGPLNQDDQPCHKFIFDYRPERIELKLRISNSSKLQYAPILHMKITSAKLFDPSGTKIIQDAVDILYNKVDDSGNYTLGDVKIVGINQQILVNNKNEIESIYPKTGYYIKLPLTIDLNKIPNPQHPEDKYSLTVEYEYWDDEANSHRQPMQTKFDVIIKKNLESIELGVNLQQKYHDGYKTLSVVSSSTPIEYPITTNGGGANITYRIAIQNTATIIQKEHPNAGIIIRNFKSTGIAFKDGVTAKTNGDEIIDISSFCNCKPYSEAEKVLMTNGSINIDIPFNMTTAIDHFSSPSKDKLYKVEAEVKVYFDYYIDNIGTRQFSEPFKHFEESVVFPLEILPQREWLGIDFGSSAVVALYGNTINLANGLPQNCIQDLKVTKTRGLAKAYPGADKSHLRSVTDEDIFINSRIVLGNKFPSGKKNVNDFSEYPDGVILFSPGDGFNYSKLLPSLKSMMGYDLIPLVTTSITNPPHVDDIYEMAYQQLFNLYIKSISKHQQKIIMTYPNTFATRHVARLKQLAKECMPDLREDYIVTISESDAVAFRYLMLRARLGITGDVDRNVLIYDMGAGTLDITYFSNIMEGGIRKVDIKGKFGISKAGNYLDYVLAEIVVDICNTHGFKDPNGKSFDGLLSLDSQRAGDISASSKLKNYVKDKLKPLLAKSDNNTETTMPKWDSVSSTALESVPLSEVFGHFKFTKFIDDISTEVIEGCNNIFPGGLYDADVIVFSGRMSSMQSIRTAVMAAVNKIVKSKDKNKVVIPKDIAQSEADGGTQLQVRKTAVVEGALNYVESVGILNQDENDGNQGDIVLLPPKPFFARYCVIVHKLPDDYSVIDHVDNSMEAEGYSASKKIDLTSVYALYLIQTYAVGNKAIINDFIGDRNLTTVLESRETTNIRGSFSIAVKVECHENRNRFEQGASSVSLWIGGNSNSTLPHENIQSTAFRKSAWPIVFV